MERWNKREIFRDGMCGENATEKRAAWEASLGAMFACNTPVLAQVRCAGLQKNAALQIFGLRKDRVD